jgi:hypothetical protein
MKADNFSFRAVLCCIPILLLLNACSFYKTPKKAWTEDSCPKPPDYSQLDNWAAHPDKVDFADGTPSPEIKNGQAEAEIDVFFVHPTTLFGKKEWNGNVSDEKLNERTEKRAIKHQASIFNGVGRVYAPRYRQMSLGGFYDKHDVKSNGKAFHTAYCDIKASFEYYLAHFNQGRPIMIVSHSQGSAHAIHLLKDYFDGKDIQPQLVAAYIPGWPVPADTFSTLKPCETPSETGCYASWCSFEYHTQPKHPEWYDNAVVVNPITWRTVTLPSQMDEHKGTVMGDYSVVYPNVLIAQSNTHILWVTRPDIKGTNIIGSNNFHIADFNLFWLDVRENAILRAGKYLSDMKAGR